MTDQEIIEKLREDNEKFKKLEDEHRSLDMKIAEIENKKYLDPEEDMKKRELKKAKLSMKDQIAIMVNEYKRGLS